MPGSGCLEERGPEPQTELYQVEAPANFGQLGTRWPQETYACKSADGRDRPYV